MCNLEKELKKEEFIGYKVVAEKEGKNYSLAMGFCYDDYPDRVPVVKKQVNLTVSFNNDILEDEFTHNKKMEGRTAIFKLKNHCEFESHSTYLNPECEGYALKVKKAKVSIDLMSGIYAGVYVVAGRKIEFLE